MERNDGQNNNFHQRIVPKGEKGGHVMVGSELAIDLFVMLFHRIDALLHRLWITDYVRHSCVLSRRFVTNFKETSFVNLPM